MQINNFYLEGYVSQPGNADMTQMQINTSNNCQSMDPYSLLNRINPNNNFDKSKINEL